MSGNDDPTPRQREVLDVLDEFHRTDGVPPSTRKIAKKLGRAQATVMGHLRELAKKSLVKKLADGKWALIKHVAPAAMPDIPVYGSIPAGLATTQEQEPDEMLAVSPAVFGAGSARPDQFWFLRVRGDSMIGANILDGDLVALVRREPRPGEIVAALVNETETTLKWAVREEGRMILRAANPRFPDSAPAHLEAQGVVVGIIRRKIGLNGQGGEAA
ncbi:MAG TPA: S24 family peptidase [Bryobacteraceae bacterium]|nr:S24 family peptidase [Bryobacteraceae bacterium]